MKTITFTGFDDDPVPEGKVRVRRGDSIFLHWFNVSVWLVMLATGFGIVSGAFVRMIPTVWPEFMQGLFGGNAQLANVHAWIGVAWVAVFTVYTLLAARRVFCFLKNVLVLTPWGAAKDAWSMAASIGDLFGLKLPRPVAGRFNGAQRLLGTLIVFGSLGIAGTGLYLYFSPKLLNFSEVPLYAAIFRWSLTVHISLVMLVLIGLVAHIYFAIVEEPESLEAMTKGTLPAEFIEHHNPKWYEELVEDGKVDP